MLKKKKINKYGRDNLRDKDPESKYIFYKLTELVNLDIRLSLKDVFLFNY